MEQEFLAAEVLKLYGLAKDQSHKTDWQKMLKFGKKKRDRVDHILVGPSITCLSYPLHRGGCFHPFHPVGPEVRLHKNNWTDALEIWWTDGVWFRKELIDFWSGSGADSGSFLHFHEHYEIVCFSIFPPFSQRIMDGS